MQHYILIALLALTIGQLTYTGYYVTTKKIPRNNIITIATTTEENSSVTSQEPKPKFHGVTPLSTFNVAAQAYYSTNQNNNVLSKAIILSSGDVVYVIHNPIEKKDTLFLNDKEIASVDTLISLKEIGGTLAYLSQDATSKKYILTYGGKNIENIVYDARTAGNPHLADYSFMEIGNKIAYLTIDPTTKKQTLVHGDIIIATGDTITYTSTEDLLAYAVYSKKTNKETLFYNGKQIKIADSFKMKEVHSKNGKLMYIYSNTAIKKETIVFNNKELSSHTSIFDAKIIKNKPIYTVKDADIKLTLIYDDQKLAESTSGFMYEEVGGELAYAYPNPIPQNNFIYTDLIYGTTKIASVCVLYSIRDVDGKLFSTRRVSPTDKNISMFYDNTFLKEEYMPDDATFEKINDVFAYVSITADGTDSEGVSLASIHYNYDNQMVVTARYMSKPVRSKIATSSPYYFYAIRTPDKISSTITVYKVE